MAEQQRDQREHHHDPHRDEHLDLRRRTPEPGIKAHRRQRGTCDQEDRRDVEHRAAPHPDPVQGEHRSRQRPRAEAHGSGEQQMRPGVQPARRQEPQRTDEQGRDHADQRIHDEHPHEARRRLVGELHQQRAEADEEYQQAQRRTHQTLRERDRPLARTAHGGRRR
ncbi:hypothetical protein H3H54_01410 [Brachybacterium sp. Z12]|uniref:hypothetical protein n=1 Tax=Brachybacterium sp. Z12 TaxID=2759167 RepID=UPI0018614D35|nr:hypothetical protein [Brachybacterium sp. Z12]QNN82658.1 hypothetical protein H3H54_01410 [Brachybacterium sp. Z12]